MEIIKECCYCGKEFASKDPRKIYCSKTCKDIVSRLRRGIKCNVSSEPYKKVCAVCGKEYETRREASVCCSRECSKEYEKQRDRKRSYKQKKGSVSLEEYKKKIKAEADQRKKTKQLEKQWYKATHTVERECDICGRLFYCLDTENRKTCSSECARRHRNIKNEKRIPRAQKVDIISLKRLYKRDNGTCYLCGQKCDWDSKNISPKGNEYCGDLYPTIEHVIPVSKGGLDSWDNVRLACWKCNTKKSDGIIKIEPMSRERAYSQQYSKSMSKKTAQYSLEGELIRIWDSTGQIERELGLNSKHIQNTCRKSNTKTGNAYGYHWEYVV